MQSVVNVVAITLATQLLCFPLLGFTAKVIVLSMKYWSKKRIGMDFDYLESETKKKKPRQRSTTGSQFIVSKRFVSHTSCESDQAKNKKLHLTVDALLEKVVDKLRYHELA